MMIMRTRAIATKTTREIWDDYWARKFKRERERREEERRRLLFGSSR